MFKTCIIVPRVGQVPDTINHILDDIGVACRYNYLRTRSSKLLCTL